MRKTYAALMVAILVPAFTLRALPAVLPAPPDSIVQMAAESQGLEQVAPQDIPRYGTFWWVTAGGYGAPMPTLPPNTTAPVYQIADGQFLVDASGGQVVGNPRRFGQSSDMVSLLAAQGDAVVSLINRVQDAQFNQEISRALGFDTELDTPDIPSPLLPAYDTNLLWLEITNVSNGWSHLNLHNATNQVYAIWTTPDLLTPWNVETELWPTDTNCQPFALQNFGRQNLFVRAEDWTGVTENGNTTPDWWLWAYFGTTALSDTNLDSGGVNSLGYDYANGIDPNVIQFNLESVNDYVKTVLPTVQVNLTAGNPSYYAVLVNHSTATNWLPFATTNLPVLLGATDGVYAVSVGLRGLPADAVQTWEDYAFTLDRVAPVVTITNPVLTGATATVIKPYLQLQGFANEQIASLSYDISNVFGLATNLDAFVTDQVFDTNKFDFTTNYFQAYDVPLATNANNITLRVTDRAGDVTVTNFNVVLDYSTATVPPVVTLIWPQDGMAVSGTNITIRGTMSDETGTIRAQIVDEDGNTNTVTGLVERNNMFWLENVPLNGETEITLQATDAAGNVTVTNFMVEPSDVQLTIDSVPTGDALWQPYGSVSGTIGDDTSTVWVNGMQVSNYWPNLDGTWGWSADNVPIYGQGTATFDAVAYPPVLGRSMAEFKAAAVSPSAADGGGAATANANTDPEMDSHVAMVDYFEGKTDSYHYKSGTFWDNFLTKNYHAQAQAGTDGQWHETYTGYASDNVIDPFGCLGDWFDCFAELTWSETNQGTLYFTSQYGDPYNGPLDADQAGYAGLKSMPDADQTWGCASCGEGYESGWLRHYYAKNAAYQLHWGANAEEDLTVSAVTLVKLYTGGKASVQRQNLFCINVPFATEFLPPTGSGSEFPWGNLGSQAMDKTRLLVAGKHPGVDGNVWLALPDNSEQFITVTAPGIKHFDADSTAAKYKSYFEVYVNQPDPTGHSTHSSSFLDWGHAWYGLSTEAPRDAVNLLIPSNLIPILVKTTAGYHYTGSLSINGTAPGILNVPDGGIININRRYKIGFDDLISGLNYTFGISNAPGTYNVRRHNCVHITRGAGDAVHFPLPPDITPENFGYDLPPEN